MSGGEISGRAKADSLLRDQEAVWPVDPRAVGALKPDIEDPEA